MTTSWRITIALRDLLELAALFGFLVVVPSLVEHFLTARGVSTVGSNRIVATTAIFIAWALLAALLLALNREPISNVGLARIEKPVQTILYGLLTAVAIFAVVVTLERLGYGRERLGDMALELKGNFTMLVERAAISLLVVGFVEEFIFRGFIMSRLANILGGSRVAWMIALILQAALFGLSHGYQELFGMVLTGVIGLFLGSIYLMSGKNLWIVVIGHGAYDAAHAFYIAFS